MNKKVFHNRYSDHDRYALGKWLVKHNNKFYYIFCWPCKYKQCPVSYCYSAQRDLAYKSLSIMFYSTDNLSITTPTFQDAINWIQSHD